MTQISLDRAIEIMETDAPATTEEQAEARLMALAALKMAKAEIIGSSVISSTGIYDESETHTNCTVEVWSNSITGETSVGWWQNEGGEEHGK